MSDANRSSAGFSNFNRTLGSGELATGQETPASLSCLELGVPSEASAGFSNFNRTLGSGALATGQETLPIRVLGSACFFLLPFFFNRRKLAVRGYKRRHTYDRASFRVLKGPKRCFGPNLNASGAVRGEHKGIEMMSRSAHRILSKKKQVAGMAGGAIAMLALAGPALTDDNEDGNSSKKDEVFKVTTVIQVPAAASNTAGTFFSFDISWFDPKLNKFFLTDRNNKAIDVVDAKNPAGITQFPNPGFHGVDPAGNDFSGPDGVLTANNSTELWVGDSPGRVWVMDARTGAIKMPAQMNGQANPILVGGVGRADELCYDPKDNIILIASPHDGFVTSISATTYKVLNRLDITTGTGIEQCAWNPKDGNFYQNVPNDPDPGDQVFVISPTTPLKVVRKITIDIKDCSGVRGNAFGLDNQLLIGCSTPSPPNNQRNSIVIDATSGPTAKVLKVLKNLGGADEVWFNPETNHYVIPSCNTPCRTVGANGTEQLGIVDSAKLLLDASVTVAEQNGVKTPLPPPNPRTIHSAAAGGNLIFLPIPAVGGTVPQFDPTLCASFDDFVRVGTPTASTGCIAILQAKPDK